MSILDNAKPISEMGQRKLVVLWGKSNTGKTEVGSTWPTPMLYVQVGDDGANTIRNKKGIKGVRVSNISELKDLIKELTAKKGAGYKTVFIDTFSMIVSMWIDENAVQKKKKMTQQMWGDLKTDSDELTLACHKLASHVWTLISCHEAMDKVEGMEDEILPDSRPSLSKGSRTYLEGMANFGFHTTKQKKEIVTENGTKEVVRYAMHIGPNPYYWTKLQTPKEIKVPAIMVNPSYKKLVDAGLIEE